MHTSKNASGYVLTAKTKEKKKVRRRAADRCSDRWRGPAAAPGRAVEKRNDLLARTFAMYQYAIYNNNIAILSCLYRIVPRRSP